MREITVNRGQRAVWEMRKKNLEFTPAQVLIINKVYEQKTRNKNEFMCLRLIGNAYEFAYYGKKNRYLCCPETRFKFYPNGVCEMSKDDAQGYNKEFKYYEY